MSLKFLVILFSFIYTHFLPTSPKDISSLTPHLPMCFQVVDLLPEFLECQVGLRLPQLDGDELILERRDGMSGFFSQLLVDLKPIKKLKRQ